MVVQFIIFMVKIFVVSEFITDIILWLKVITFLVNISLWSIYTITFMVLITFNLWVIQLSLKGSAV